MWIGFKIGDYWIMATVRMQVIQRFLLDKKNQEDTSDELPSASQIIKKAVKTAKYSPVLSKRPAQGRSVASSSIRPSMKADFSPLNTLNLKPAQSSRNFFKPSSKTLLESSSLEMFKPNKLILHKKILGTLTKTTKKPQKPQKSLQIENKELKAFDCKVTNKAELDRVWRKVFFLSNGVEIFSTVANYFAFVDKGNNSPLVKKLILARPWWKLVDSKEKANFVWTQWKNKSVLEGLRSGASTCRKLENVVLNWPVICKNLWPKGRNNENEQFGLHLITNSSSFLMIAAEKSFTEAQRLHNHLESNFCLTNKKGLYQTMKTYCEVLGKDLFDLVPLTFHVKSEEDPEFSAFLHHFHQLESQKPAVKNVWIVKPGENSNRGNGITVSDSLAGISELIKPAENKTFIIQKYIENPLLINQRKFDIRCYAMLTSINGVIQGYFYLDGYLRTASQEFSLETVEDKFVHLTNDAIQKHSTEYGKYENGNKMSYREFCTYLENHHPNVNFFNGILLRIKEIVKETFVASFLEIDKNKRLHCMEIFGFDFMVDQQFKPWLIEINTNPCLELASPHLRIIIPSMLENAFKIVLDTLFPPPYGQAQEFVQINRFELIFHQEKEGKQMAESVARRFDEEGITV
jgi:tubulin--tyrosine ligase